jgi:hypothetical protein
VLCKAAASLVRSDLRVGEDAEEFASFAINFPPVEPWNDLPWLRVWKWWRDISQQQVDAMQALHQVRI